MHTGLNVSWLWIAIALAAVAILVWGMTAGNNQTPTTGPLLDRERARVARIRAA